MSAGSFDWKSLQKYLNPQAAEDFSRFLDTVPGNAGKTVLVAAGIAWGAAAAFGLFALMQSSDLNKLRAELESTEAIKPVVPIINYASPNPDDLKRAAEQFKQVYPGLTMNVNGDTFSIQSKNTSDFTQFREALGHIVNGGIGWKVSVDGLCIGRECKQNALDAVLKIQKLNIDKPSS